MKILILGADGYLGHATVKHFKNLGHDVFGIDNLWKRQTGQKPLNRGDIDIDKIVDLKDYYDIEALLDHFKPDCIIHYAEIPSAPFSMEGPFRTTETMTNNVNGTLNLLWAMKEKCPDAHLVKIGSMGEYGSPDCAIPEGYIPKLCFPNGSDVECPMAGLPFPKSPSSFYHLSKVHDSHNIRFACKIWGLKATDLNQGVVYGGNSRFHYDAVFGTVLNRFCAQAVVREKLTVYGSGNQRRGFLNIKDTLQCVELAVMNPAESGECRVYNQYTQTFTVNELANKIANITGAEIAYLGNPRIEAESSRLDTTNDSLIKLGLKPHLLGDESIREILAFVYEHKNSIDKNLLSPKIHWR